MSRFPRARLEPIFHHSFRLPIVDEGLDVLKVLTGQSTDTVLHIELGAYRIGFGTYSIGFREPFTVVPALSTLTLGYLDILIAKVPVPIFVLGVGKERFWGLSFASEGTVLFTAVAVEQVT